MNSPVLFGAGYSVYTRSARLALHEKGVSYRLEEIDIFAATGPSAEHLRRQPFARIPVLEHEGFSLYETSAILQYIDDAFAGPPLQPVHPRARARMRQVISILDSYAYRAMVWGVFVERTNKPARGETSDEVAIAAALTISERCMAAIEAIMADGLWLAGAAETPSLADFHAAPMIAYLREAPEGNALLSRHPRLAAWWERMARRSSMEETKPPVTSSRA